MLRCFESPGGCVIDPRDLGVDSIKARDHDCRSLIIKPSKRKVLNVL